ncbi:MAG TPA: prephenate dehydratase [Deltaproteobacteria bacterium]|nr:prephenate dehydratase [Deltaproteobacteria bacterium]
MHRLDELRTEIDGIDCEILDLLNRRAACAIEIGKIKHEQKRDVYAPDREREIYRRLMERNKGPFPNKALRNVFREIISGSISLEKQLKVAFLGPPATFTHQACMQHFGLMGEFVPKKDIADIFDDVERGRADYGVVPIENTTEGVVTHTLEMFVTSSLKICAEILIEVSLALMNRSGRLGEITKVLSHPHAIAQCRKWLKEHLADAAVAEVSSTAMAAQLASEDESAAAIASEAAAALYDLKIVERAIEDQADNLTRFLVIGKNDSPRRTGMDKTSLMFATKDTPGALYRMLQPFATRGINLTKIESRPMKRKSWQYVFFLDLDGHITDGDISEAVSELEGMCSFLKHLGSYPKSV